MDSTRRFSPPLTPPPSGRLPSSEWAQQTLTVRRPLGPNELAYFLPSRAGGVNDMYLHHHFTVGQAGIVDQPGRIATAWAILRGRHPLLAARVERSLDVSGPGKNDVWVFVYDAPRSSAEALATAVKALTLAVEQTATATSEERIEAFLNGPRRLSADKLAHLFVARSPSTPSAGEPAVRADVDTSSSAAVNAQAEAEADAWDVLLFVGHFAADGMALHALADALFTLAFGPAGADEGEHEVDNGGGKGRSAIRSVGQLERLLERETIARLKARSTPFPPSADERLQLLVLGPSSRPPAPRHSAVDGSTNVGPLSATNTALDRMSISSPPFNPRQAWRRAVGRVLYQRTMERGVGGQALARSSSELASDSPRTRVSTLLLSKTDTIAALAACKRQNVNVGQAVVGALNAAWAAIQAGALKKEEPSLFYSAMSIRPYLADESSSSLKIPAEPSSFVHLALGYYTLSLPSFLVSPAANDITTVWHRARQVKQQTARLAARGWPTAARVWAEGESRGERARDWARKDDEAEAAAAAVKTGNASLVGLGLGVEMVQGSVERPPALEVEEPAKSVASAEAAAYSPPLSEPTTPAAPAFATAAGPASAKPSTKNVPLLGLSLLGNLDAIYRPGQAYPVVQLQRLTTGSRQRSGAALLFVYTFSGRLGLSLGWEMGTLGEDEGELGRWWSTTQKALGEAVLDRVDGLKAEEHVV